MNGKKRKLKGNKPLSAMTLQGTVLLIIILAMLWNLTVYFKERVHSTQYSEKLQETVMITASYGTEETESDDTDKETVVPAEIDFEQLQNINPEAIAWIYAPETAIHYAIAQTKDNHYYLNHQLDGSESISGTLFMDYRNHADFSDWNTIIYGHNMKDGTMFGSLLGYGRPDYYEKHPIMYIYVPGARYKLELIAGYTVNATDAIYHQLPASLEGRNDILNRACEASDFTSGIVPDAEDRLVTLSTCTYSNNDARYVIIGRLAEDGIKEAGPQ